MITESDIRKLDKEIFQLKKEIEKLTKARDYFANRLGEVLQYCQTNLFWVPSPSHEKCNNGDHEKCGICRGCIVCNQCGKFDPCR